MRPRQPDHLPPHGHAYAGAGREGERERRKRAFRIVRILNRVFVGDVERMVVADRVVRAVKSTGVPICL